MKTYSAGTKHSRSWAILKVLLAAGWLFVSVVDLTTAVVLSHWTRKSVSLFPTMIGLFGFWGLHAALTPFLVWALARVPFERGRIGRAVAWSMGLLPVYAGIHFLMRYVWEGTFLRPGTSALMSAWLRTPDFLQVYLMGTIFAFLVTAGAVNGMEFYLRYRERERTAAALQREKADLRASLTEARLEVLQAQLQPHFLFNALHARALLWTRRQMAELCERRHVVPRHPHLRNLARPHAEKSADIKPHLLPRCRERPHRATLCPFVREPAIQQPWCSAVRSSVLLDGSPIDRAPRLSPRAPNLVALAATAQSYR